MAKQYVACFQKFPEQRNTPFLALVLQELTAHYYIEFVGEDKSTLHRRALKGACSQNTKLVKEKK